MKIKALNWPLLIAAIFLTACASLSGSRFLASAAKPADTHGLGSFACLKEGFARSGYGHVSNRSLAMIAVVARWQSASLPGEASSRDRAALTNTLQTVLAYGACDKKALPFSTEADVVQSEEWLSTNKLSQIDPARYQALFAIDKSFVMFYNTANNPWTSLNSQRKLFFWNRYAEGFDPYVCASPFPEGDKKKICAAVIESCGLESHACDEPGEIVVE